MRKIKSLGNNKLKLMINISDNYEANLKAANFINKIQLDRR
jgi:hypothetical protein